MNNDKFIYKDEKEIQLFNSMCEICKYYNDGLRSDECPKELIEQIKNGDLKCPNFNDDSFFYKEENK